MFSQNKIKPLIEELIYKLDSEVNRDLQKQIINLSSKLNTISYHRNLGTEDFNTLNIEEIENKFYST